MRKIKYLLLQSVPEDGNPVTLRKVVDYSEDAEKTARVEACNGEPEIFDDGQPTPTETPSQLDTIEAQVAYTAMMTDTLLEV